MPEQMKGRNRKGIQLRFTAVLLAVLTPISSIAADEWPQWRGPARDGVWRETGIVEAFDGLEIPVRWRVPIGSGYSGPSVANGRVYVTDRLAKPKQVERVHCFAWETGELIWSYTYDCEYRINYVAGPRATVTVHNGLAYALGAMGHLHCFNAATGALKWKRDLNSEYNIAMPTWGIASAPIVEGSNVIVQAGGTPGACIVAFDRETGVEKWKALDDKASYSAPIAITQGSRRVLVCRTAESIVGLNPKTGGVYWRHPFPPKRMEIGIASPVFYHNELFFTDFFDGSLLLKVNPDKPEMQFGWHRKGKDERNTDALHSTMSTPVRLGDYIYGVDSYGELRCLDARNGERIWEDLTAVPKARWSNIHFIRNGDRVWMFNERGELLITTLSPDGLNVISRAKLIEPTRDQLNRRGGVTWAHPAFAYKHVFVRNDEELVCASLAKSDSKQD